MILIWTLLVLASLIALAWCGINAIYPIKRLGIRTRKAAGAWAIAACAGIVVAVWGGVNQAARDKDVATGEISEPPIAMATPPAVPDPTSSSSGSTESTEPSNDQEPAPVATVSKPSEKVDAAIQDLEVSLPVARCGENGIATNEELRVVVDRVFLLDAPGKAGKKQENAKATAALGSVQYQLIDKSTTVRELCHDGDWSRVQITDPEWLSDQQGWVPATAVKPIELTATGVRQYVMSDLVLDAKTTPWKDTILAGVNKVAQENENCKKLDASSAYISSNKGTKKHPVFYVTCDDESGQPFNVFFSADDVKAGAKFAAIKPVDKQSAIDVCEAAARTAATHPSTVDFSRFIHTAFQQWPNGRARLVSRFTAKNSLNLELPFDIACLFEGNKLIETTIAEAKD